LKLTSWGISFCGRIYYNKAAFDLEHYAHVGPAYYAAMQDKATAVRVFFLAFDTKTLFLN